MEYPKISIISIIILFTLLMPVQNSNNQISANNDSLSEETMELCQVDDTSLVTWTSPTSTNPNPLINGSDITGDHVKLIVNENFFDFTNYTSEIHVKTSGYINQTFSGELVVPDEDYDFVNAPIYGYEDQYTWIEITGIQQGKPVYLTGYHTNNDSDFLGFAGNIPPEEYSYMTSTLGNRMATQRRPETTQIYWTYPTDTLIIAVFSWSHEPGNFTFTLEQGRSWTEEAQDQPVEFDSYQIGDNRTVDIIATIYSERGTISQTYSNITLNNFFSANVENIQVTANSTRAYLTWSIDDKNINETHICEIHLSRESSSSSSLMGYAYINWTFELNFTNFLLADDYYFMIRAIDTGGAVGIGLSEVFRAGTEFQAPTRVIKNIQLTGPSLFSFVNGSENNEIKWIPMSNETFQYRIQINNEVIEYDIWNEGEITLNLDTLAPGTYTVLLEASSILESAYGSSEVIVIVYEAIFEKNQYLEVEYIQLIFGIFVISLSVLFGEFIISKKIRK